MATGIYRMPWNYAQIRSEKIRRHLLPIDAPVPPPPVIDTHDGDTWREHRQGLRQLAKLAEERRRAKDEEAGDIRQEILAALGEAKPLEGGAEVRDALDAITAALPSRAPESVTEAQLRRVTDWAPIYAAMEDLRRAIEFERMLEQDDEEVLLLI